MTQAKEVPGDPAFVYERARLRRETATVFLAAILSGPAGGSGGVDDVTERSIEWADRLLERLSRS